MSIYQVSSFFRLFLFCNSLCNSDTMRGYVEVEVAVRIQLKTKSIHEQSIFTKLVDTRH